MDKIDDPIIRVVLPLDVFESQKKALIENCPGIYQILPEGINTILHCGLVSFTSDKFGGEFNEHEDDQEDVFLDNCFNMIEALHEQEDENPCRCVSLPIQDQELYSFKIYQILKELYYQLNTLLNNVLMTKFNLKENYFEFKNSSVLVGVVLRSPEGLSNESNPKYYFNRI